MNLSSVDMTLLRGVGARNPEKVSYEWWGEGDLDAHEISAAVARAGFEVGTHRRGPLAHSEGAEARARREHDAPRVRHLEFDEVGSVAQADIRRRVGARMAARVRQRLLRDAVQVDLGERGHRPRGSYDPEARRGARRLRRPHQR